LIQFRCCAPACEGYLFHPRNGARGRMIALRVRGSNYGGELIPASAGSFAQVFPSRAARCLTFGPANPPSKSRSHLSRRSKQGVAAQVAGRFPGPRNRKRVRPPILRRHGPSGSPRTGRTPRYS
jgi:hypothetical protein